MRDVAMKIVFTGNGTYSGIVHIRGVLSEELFCKELTIFACY
jgi:hypothetical protein